MKKGQLMKADNRKIGLLQATSIAVGTMIGASIFSIFGLGATIAGHNLPLVFVASGIVALLVAYSYLITHQFQLSRLISNRGKNNGLHWLFHRVASLHCQIWPKSTLVCIIVRIQVCLCRRGWTRLNWAAWRLKMVGNQDGLCTYYLNSGRINARMEI